MGQGALVYSLQSACHSCTLRTNLEGRRSKTHWYRPFFLAQMEFAQLVQAKAALLAFPWSPLAQTQAGLGRKYTSSAVNNLTTGKSAAPQQCGLKLGCFENVPVGWAICCRARWTSMKLGQVMLGRQALACLAK